MGKENKNIEFVYCGEFCDGSKFIFNIDYMLFNFGFYDKVSIKTKACTNQESII